MTDDFADGKRKLDPAVRRAVMASIPKTNSRPELVLRRALWAKGIRGWRCHVKKIAGTPDIAFSKWKLAVFVDGVWWHGRDDYLPRGKRGPYWDAKIERNKRRDVAINQRLAGQGWIVLRFWDLDILKNPDEAVKQIGTALAARRHHRGPLERRNPSSTG